MGRSSRRGVAALIGSILGSAIACRAPTEITIHVTTSAPCLQLPTGVAITVASSPERAQADADKHFTTASTGTCDGGEIGTLVVTPGASSVGIVVVSGFAGKNTAECSSADGYDRCIVARRNLAFVEHTNLDVPIALDPLCVGIACDAFSTCRGGRCLDAHLVCDESGCHEAGDFGDAGSSTDGQADAAVDGSGDATTDAGSLPSDAACNVTAGGPMAYRSYADRGLRYCMDRTEVTQAAYHAFLERHLPSGRSALCPKPGATNDPAANGQYGCDAAAYRPDATPNNPVVCVDECDAETYCQSVGKRLCRTGGADEEFQVACQSDDANNGWTFGRDFDGHLCNGSEYGAAGTVPVASLARCATTGPATPIFDLTGNVWEYTTGVAFGGGFKSGPTELGCRFASGPNEPYSNEIGFRCCKDP